MAVKNIFLIVFLSFITSNETAYEEVFLNHEIVPDVLSEPPEGVLKVIFPNGIEAQLGNELSPSQVIGEPILKWDYSSDHFYTVVFCDADAPSRSNPEARSFLHWLVVNIPGDDVKHGETLTNILNSHPEPETGLHRYLFLVYQQPGVILFDEKPDDSFTRRFGFSPEDFSKKYGFGTAVAGNFYQTENLEDED